MRTLEHLLEDGHWTLEDVAEKSGVDLDRVIAIAEGRWLPSPDEREKIAAALGMPVEEISWGHTMNPRNVRYRRFGFKENF